MIEATLNYLAPMAEKPTYYLHPPPEGTPWRNTRGDRRKVSIRDARDLEADPRLDVEGFALAEHRTSVEDLYDPEHVKSRYFPEMEELVRKVTGANRVVAFDHNVRHGAEERQDGVSAPVLFVHNDYTLTSGPQRVRDLIPDEAEALLENRVAVINLWKPIRGPVMDKPLAFCSAPSLGADDLISTALKYEDREGEVQSCVFNPSHRWYYYPQMQAHEVVLLKCFDSDPRRACFTAHTAFDEPSGIEAAPPRESIEVRTLAFFDP